MFRYILLLFLVVFLSFSGRTSHVAGGDITWTCQGGNYVFQLVFYRDCNGADINPVSETLDVWGHPSVSSITLSFISRTDISPICTAVAGGPPAVVCGSGPNAGNGLGAIEKVIYRSAPIALPGTPPASGWVFTYQNFSRSGAISNLVDPSTKGTTLVSKMFAIPGSAGCVDNSPQFLQDPYFVSCAGDPYAYNMNAVDPDLDSLHISFSSPLDHFPSQTYNPPSSPVALQFEAGYSVTSPTPGTSMNAANIPAQINPGSGELTFLSMNIGSYVVKITAKSYRNGILIAEVDREMQLFVKACAGTNTPPDIVGPFGGLFETTVNAGTLVNFNLNATDVEVLQDGSPQNNLLSASGLMFGTGFTSTTGCAIAPCATLNATPLITMPQGVTTNFNWQTDCDHLVTPFGTTEDVIPYHFVFKVQDDYCPTPKVSYVTVTINIVNPGILDAPEIDCIQTDAAGNLTLSWTPIVDPFGTFTEYRIYSVQSGLVGTVPTIGSNSFTFPGAGQDEAYTIAVASGCDGNALRFSDTVSNIHLDLNNPLNGTAVLQWNAPTNPAQIGMNAYYHIYREYPAGVWSIYDSVPFGTTFYIDTIDICDVFLNYQIVLPNTPCDYSSIIAGDQFQDMITPDIPMITSVTIDTLTGNVVFNWNQNNQPDTYGYVIYGEDANGFIVEIDTVWGIANTNYTHTVNTANGPLTYSVAAFDSCWTAVVPPTYQTSAKAPVHTTSFLTSTLDICTQKITLNWSSYIGWSGVDHYDIYVRVDGQAWSMAGTAAGNSFVLDALPNKNYCIAIEAVATTGARSFSNIACLFTTAPLKPAVNYLRVATVSGDAVTIRHFIDNSVTITGLSLQRKTPGGTFEEIAILPAGVATSSYTDEDVDVHSNSYVYRVQIIDSCGLYADFSNEAQTILLTLQKDDVAKRNYLSWNNYQSFDGSILGYQIYRGIDNVFGGAPIATVPVGQRSFEDDVNDVISNGTICYYVEALEAINTYSFAEVSQSNVNCMVLPPLVYIPNAFMPDGINKIFRPVISDFDATQYAFSIYDRYGQVIFHTNAYDQGWDGVISASGKMAEPGVYNYLVQVVDGYGVQIIHRGHVTLLK